MTEEHRKKISEGTRKAMGRPEIKEKIRQGCLAKYGVEWNCLRPEANNSVTVSKINREWQKKLNIPEEDIEFPVKGFSYDLKKGNTLIEINPSVTHNSTKINYKRKKSSD